MRVKGCSVVTANTMFLTFRDKTKPQTRPRVTKLKTEYGVGVCKNYLKSLQINISFSKAIIFTLHFTSEDLQQSQLVSLWT